MSPLQIGYVLDLAVSLPVALVTLIGSEPAAKRLFREKLPEDPSVRIALGAMWLAIALGSAAGIALPVAMAPVLVLQLVYKGLWILLFALPRWLGGRFAEVPLRTALTFLAFVVVYPWIVPWQAVFAPGD